MVSLERAVSQKDAHNHLQEYSIKLGPGDDPNNPASEQRGVLIIKSKSKTRAKQRKGAVTNWKVIYLLTFIYFVFFFVYRAHPVIRIQRFILQTCIMQQNLFIGMPFEWIWILTSTLVKYNLQISLAYLIEII